jgi:membrane protein
MFAAAWKLLVNSTLSFIDDEALSRGAAIAFYAVTSLAPVLLIVMGIAGLVFGREAAQDAITGQFSGLMGKQAADVLQAVIAGASAKSSGILATLSGIAMLIVTASGVFAEMQAALNTIWKSRGRETALSRLFRARVTSLGLVAAMGFLLVVSLAVSAGLSAFSDYLDRMPIGAWILSGLNFAIAWLLFALLFGAIYKVLPDRTLQWKDVIVGAMMTSLLFNVGKTLIGWYIGSSAVASSYGAAGGLIVLLLWVFYSAQVFLFGAELTKAYANVHGSKRSKPAGGRGL